jgi:NADH-quinone oxidoreductase subunit A
MEHLVPPILPIFLLVVCVVGLAVGLLIAARIVRPGRPGRVTRMPYESGMDPIHDTRRRFDVRFYLVAIAFLVFDVELLFLYPWAVSSGMAAHNRQSVETERAAKADGRQPVAASQRPVGEASSRGGRATDSRVMFGGAMTFVVLLTLGYVYDWRKGVFQWH